MVSRQSASIARSTRRSSGSARWSPIHRVNGKGSRAPFSSRIRHGRPSRARRYIRSVQSPSFALCCCVLLVTVAVEVAAGVTGLPHRPCVWLGADVRAGTAGVKRMA